MKTHLRVLAIVVFILTLGCGTASAYNKTTMQSVIINLDGAPRMVSTEKETVGELLEELANTIDTEYFLEDAEESDPIEEMMTFSLTSITEKTVASIEEIPYRTVEQKNDSLKEGERRVIQDGRTGEKSVISKEIYHGCELIETKKVSEKIITEATDKIIAVGTKKTEAPKKTEPVKKTETTQKTEPVKKTETTKKTTSANTIHGKEYSKALKAKVTAYTPYDAGCTGITATGTKASFGTIAVDPGVIPLGSKVYIPGYGVGYAADTGGAIKGNRIDVCYASKSEAFNWGVKNLTVYVLK